MNGVDAGQGHASGGIHEHGRRAEDVVSLLHRLQAAAAGAHGGARAQQMGGGQVFHPFDVPVSRRPGSGVGHRVVSRSARSTAATACILRSLTQFVGGEQQPRFRRPAGVTGVDHVLEYPVEFRLHDVPPSEAADIAAEERRTGPPLQRDRQFAHQDAAGADRQVLVDHGRAPEPQETVAQRVCRKGPVEPRPHQADPVPGVPQPVHRRLRLGGEGAHHDEGVFRIVHAPGVDRGVAAAEPFSEVPRSPAHRRRPPPARPSGSRSGSRNRDCRRGLPRPG